MFDYKPTQLSIAMDHRTSPEELTALSKSKSITVKSAIAGNPSTPVDTLVELSSIKNHSIQHSIAKNPNTPPEILSKIAFRSKSFLVQFAIAENPSTPELALAGLAKKEPNNYMLKKVFKNPNCTAELLDWAERNLNLDYSTVDQAAKSRNISIDTLVRLMERGSILDIASKRVQDYLKKADPEERERVEKLITMRDLGVPVSEDPVDLDDLDLTDLGESYRAIQRFQLWENLKYQKK